MNNTDVFKHADNCLLEDMDGELLLYNPETAVTPHLNGPSVVVWQLVDGTRTCGEIVDVVLEAFPDQAEQIPADVASVIDDLVERKALVAVD